MGLDMYETAHSLAIACLQHEKFINEVLLIGVTLGDAGAIGKRVGELERAILDGLSKPEKSK